MQQIIDLSTSLVHIKNNINDEKEELQYLLVIMLNVVLDTNL